MRFNSRGDYVAGMGNGIVSFNGFEIARGGTPAHLNDDQRIFQINDNGKWYIAIFDSSGIRQFNPNPATHIIASNNMWQAFEGTQPLSTCYGSLGSIPGAVTLSADKGVLAIRKIYQSTMPFTLCFQGLIFDVPGSDAAYGVCVIGPKAAVWTRDVMGPLCSYGVELPRTCVTIIGQPRYFTLNGEAWIGYYCDQWGFVIHKANDTSKGYIVAGGPNFSIDIVVVGGKIKWGYSRSEGEPPNDLVVGFIDPATPMVSLVTPVEPIPLPKEGDIPLIPPVWVGAYKDVNNTLGGNCRFGTNNDLRRSSDGKLIATFTGDSTLFTTPSGGEWAGIYTYMDAPGPDTVEDAQKAMYALIAKRIMEVPQGKGIVLLCQMYDRNLTWRNEATLAAIMKPYGGVPGSFPEVKAMLFFSGPDRQGGTGQHPALATWYRAIVAKVQGEPILNGDDLDMTDDQIKLLGTTIAQGIIDGLAYEGSDPLKTGDKITLTSDQGRFVSADHGLPNIALVANRPTAGAWETFVVKKVG